MGYYTKYNLEWEAKTNKTGMPNCNHIKPVGSKFCPECGKPIGFMDISDLISKYLEENKERFYGIDSNGNCIDETKWYNHEKDMIHLSKKFPDYLFTLNGEGEGNDDIWRKYFLNGKMQTAMAKITFDECTLQ